MAEQETSVEPQKALAAQDPFWNPYAAGIALGLVLLASFIITGKGLGASGAINRVAASMLHAVDPTWAEDNKLIGAFFGPGATPLNAWIVYLFVGVFIGGVIAVFSARRLVVTPGESLLRSTNWSCAAWRAIRISASARHARWPSRSRLGRQSLPPARWATGSCRLRARRSANAPTSSPRSRASRLWCRCPNRPRRRSRRSRRRSAPRARTCR